MQKKQSIIHLHGLERSICIKLRCYLAFGFNFEFDFNVSIRITISPGILIYMHETPFSGSIQGLTK